MARRALTSDDLNTIRRLALRGVGASEIVAQLGTDRARTTVSDCAVYQHARAVWIARQAAAGGGGSSLFRMSPSPYGIVKRKVFAGFSDGGRASFEEISLPRVRGYFEDDAA